jgi:hypothetical protein
MMNDSVVKMWVNDYLDLYLYAKSLNDHLWQQEIIEILQNSHHYIKKLYLFLKINFQLGEIRF